MRELCEQERPLASYTKIFSESDEDALSAFFYFEACTSTTIELSEESKVLFFDDDEVEEKEEKERARDGLAKRAC